MTPFDDTAGIDPEKAENNPAARLTKLYILALSLIACLAILSQVVIQRALVSQESDAPVINIAGRQRMLSQKLAKTALAVDEMLDHCDDPERRQFVRCDEFEARIDDLREVLDVWIRSHDGLQHGDAELDLPGTNSPEVTALFEKIEPLYQAMREGAESFLVWVEHASPEKKDKAAAQPYLRTILAHEGPFLAGMNDVVFRYDAEARARVVHLERTELILMSIILFVLLSEALFVFAPAARVIRRQFTRLWESKEWLSTTLNSIGDAVIATDVKGSVRFMNPVAEGLTGWRQDDAAGKPLADIFEIINEKTGEPAENPVKRVLREGIVLGLANHTVLISRDGTRRPIDDSGAPIRDRAGQTIGAVLVFRDVAERRRAEEALRRSEAWLSTTLHSIGDAVIATDPEGSVRFMNPVAEALTGWQQDDAAERPLADVFEIINEKTGEPAENPVKRVLRKGVVLGLANHTVLISRDGTRRAIDDSGAPIQDRAGHTIGAVLIFRDVTERRRADERMRKLSIAVEQSPGLVIMTDTRGSIDYVNPKFSEVTGYSPDEVIGENPRILKSGEMPPEVYRQMWDTILGGKVWRGEFHNKRKNGELFWESASISPIKDSEAVVTGFLAVGEDMTERKRAEEALRASEELLSTTLKSIGDAVMTTDGAGCVKFMNPVAQALTGWTQDAAAGKPLTEVFVIVNEETGKQVENPVARVLREGVVVGLANHTVLIAKDGTRRPIDDSGAPIRYHAGRIVGTVLVFRDITERRQLEDELSRYRHHLEEVVAERTRELEASQEQLRLAERLASIGTLAAGVAHEINNPVGVILLTAQNAFELSKGSDNETVMNQALDKIVDNAKRCGHIVESILQFSRQETTRKWPNDLNAVLQHAVEVTRTYAQESHAVVGLELARDLPKVVFNPIEMEQVFVNLIRNAIEAGGPNLRVSICSDKTPHAVRIMIQDNGRGLTEEEKLRVFDPFYTTRQEQGGTGLGLSITHSIIKEHGGTISIQSRAGQGTTVTIALPFEVGIERSGLHVQSTDR